MFKIHVFNVKLGDSLIFETEINGDRFYSIIDCKKIGDKVPIVDFLRKNKICNIQSLFLTQI